VIQSHPDFPALKSENSDPILLSIIVVFAVAAYLGVAGVQNAILNNNQTE
jgi:hypothetical protein